MGGPVTEKVRGFISYLESRNVIPLVLKLSPEEYDDFMTENGLKLPGPGWVQCYAGTKIIRQVDVVRRR